MRFMPCLGLWLLSVSCAGSAKPPPPPQPTEFQSAQPPAPVAAPAPAPAQVKQVDAKPDRVGADAQRETDVCVVQ